MTLSRRNFLAGAAATGLLAFPAGASSSPTLTAKPGTARLVPADSPETPIWGFEGRVPGPTLRVKQGGRLMRRFVNELPQPATVHWHGVRIANAMDGVPDVTQKVVPPGDSFVYDFVAPDAGTYWYHPHNRSWEQMARGLYGALIVEEPGPPPVDRDEVLLIDDWRLTRDGSIHESFGNWHDWSHEGRIGNWITINGTGNFRETVRRHERLRLRLVNTANSRIFTLKLDGFEGWIVALDGQPLEKPTKAGDIVLAPSQRADLIVDVTAQAGKDARLISREGGGGIVIGTFNVDGIARQERTGPPTALAPNPIPPLGPLENARHATLLMEGGAMGRMPGGMMGGMMGRGMMGMGGAAGTGKMWAFNGGVDMPDAPLVNAERGETVRISMVNDTAWPHAMHLHGHHFRRVGKDSVGPLRDTLLMARGETADIAFVADNPGDWLLHCHMLEHSAGGMMTWLRVS